MLKLFMFLFFVLQLASLNVSAEVWSATNSWSEHYEEKYSEWIKHEFSDDIFSNPNSLYFGIKTDCADALLVARAIFSFEHQLPFSFKSVDDKIVSEKTSSFDHLSKDLRFKSFANSLADQISVQQLANENSYYIHPSDIRAGDYYLVRWVNKEGKINHHSYLIKDILPTGDFLLFSSTTPKAVRTLASRLGMPVQFFSGEPFGFKRFKERQSKVSLQSDLTQLSWQKFGENEFFGKVKALLRTEEDNYHKNFNRRFFNLCRTLELRLEVIKDAEKKILEKKGRCLTGSDFDEYSTPSRDQNIQREFERIINGWKTIISKKIDHGLSNDEVLGLDYLIGQNNTEDAKLALDLRCRIEFIDEQGKDFSMGLRSFYQRLKIGLVSSDPNQSMKARYGLEKAVRRCN